jgi:hypothetical protein
MTDEEHEYVYTLQGRILATEILLRNLINLLAALTNPGDRTTQVAAMEKAIMSHLQTMERPVGDEADLVWQTMSDTLRRLFEEARRAAEFQEERGGV